MDESYNEQKTNTDWLLELLEEVNLLKFHSKLINDLQLTKLSHFDYVSEDDLVQLGLSRPAAKRLLAAVKKRKSFVTALKNRIIGKLIPVGSQSTSSSGKNKLDNIEIITTNRGSPTKDSEANKPNSEFGRLTCLINSQDIQINEEIGNGVHGFVKKGEWTTPNGRVVEVALKILKKDVMSEPGASFNDFVKEISVMHQLNHPNIIKLYGVVLSSPMMMVTELAPFGNMRDKLRKESGRTPISQLINFGVQITSGLAYLESKRFVHRDLAARNIFITHGKKILIGDLGLMRAIPTQDDHYVMSERTKIPYPWCAPESLKFKQFSSSSDVYMFGVTLWEMFTFGREPWAGLTLNEILQKISTQNQRLSCPEACPNMVYQTMLQCWSTEPSLRPNFQTLYQYLSTSYPLEVRSTQYISESNQKRVNGNLVPDDLADSYSSLHKSLPSSSANPNDESNHRKVLNCESDDRILVIDGQPEKFWWKGQNQRTFEIGWFPLASTRWLAPKRGNNYISKPLKNSFVHTGHCGSDGRWGSPKFIDRMYLKNPLVPDDIEGLKTNKTTSPNSGEKNLSGSQVGSHLFSKNKTRSRLSRLFGINDSANNHNQILKHVYQKFIDEQSQITGSQSHKLRDGPFKTSMLRSQSDELNRQMLTASCSKVMEKTDDVDEPPLIDFSDDASNLLLTNQNDFLKLDCDLNGQQHMHQESLLDMGTTFPPIDQGSDFRQEIFSANQRRASDTILDNIDHLSWAGSWNTGTFYGSNSNIYSAYYCPQDAAANSNTAAAPVDKIADATSTNRYYSAVAQDYDK